MPSPFPGMNPYLERDVSWHDFHERFLILGAGIIGAQIRPDYIVRVDDHIFVQETTDESRRSIGRPDLTVIPTTRQASELPADVAVLEAPTRIRVHPLDVTREVYLNIIDRHSREVVTVVELLSPANKRKSGPDRVQYLAKRDAVIASQANLVEIDLLRGGEPMPDDLRPPCSYSIVVSRPEERLNSGFWPLRLSDPLPVIPIPLRRPRPDASLDLQALLHRVYDEAGYEYYVYDGPPQPPLTSDEAAWAESFLPKPS
ncbi:DUF4058 family protein [Paludisphaera rhizosphaerae]|uniref:DUF4058 family protein n=1 Tax=Paludisphaera rhizosphaerae TaxID=2711216 RepID=UPI0013EAFDD3|nr:DUF4058 family protein [Paludisphaera rhizosphaerae]